MAILATNLKQNIDDAFLRRLDFVVDFRFPRPPNGGASGTCVIPDQAPVADDIDIAFLGDRFKLSGGSIRNCSLAAAFEAASSGQPLRMAHVVRAIEPSTAGSAGYRRGRVRAVLRDAARHRGGRHARARREPEPEPAPARVRIGSRIEEL